MVHPLRYIPCNLPYTTYTTKAGLPIPCFVILGSCLTRQSSLPGWLELASSAFVGPAVQLGLGRLLQRSQSAISRNPPVSPKVAITEQPGFTRGAKGQVTPMAAFPAVSLHTAVKFRFGLQCYCAIVKPQAAHVSRRDGRWRSGKRGNGSAMN